MTGENEVEERPSAEGYGFDWAYILAVFLLVNSIGPSQINGAMRESGPNPVSVILGPQTFSFFQNKALL